MGWGRVSEPISGHETGSDEKWTYLPYVSVSIFQGYVRACSPKIDVFIWYGASSLST
jgi:hypothetical protein